MKTYKLNVALLATLAASLAFTACDDDDDNGGGGIANLNSKVFEIGNTGVRLTSLDDGEYIYYYSYDDNGRLADIDAEDRYNDDSFTFTSSPFTLKWTYVAGEDADGEDVNIIRNFSFTSEGYIKSYEGEYEEEGYKTSAKATCTYDGDGHLIRMEATGTLKEYGETVSAKIIETWTWRSGNLISIDHETRYDGKIDWESHQTFEYDGGLPNPHLQPNAAVFSETGYEMLGAIGLFGKGTAQFPTSGNYHQIEYSEGEVYEWSGHHNYTVGLNEDGTIAYDGGAGVDAYGDGTGDYTFGYGDGRSKKTRATAARQTPSARHGKSFFRRAPHKK